MTVNKLRFIIIINKCLSNCHEGSCFSSSSDLQQHVAVHVLTPFYTVKKTCQESYDYSDFHNDNNNVNKITTNFFHVKNVEAWCHTHDAAYSFLYAHFFSDHCLYYASILNHKQDGKLVIFTGSPQLDLKGSLHLAKLPLYLAISEQFHAYNTSPWCFCHYCVDVLSRNKNKSVVATSSKWQKMFWQYLLSLFLTVW